MKLQSIKQRFGIIGRSALLDRALDTAVRVAATDLTVLITGESGVGKEVFSKIIHTLSPRKHNKLIAINCGAIPEGTINSELFGHEKGAFTGASTERKGYFETVDGGTIFLDEIGEMPLDTQAYLLRVLESGEFIRVGSSKVIKTNVRVIAATNVDLRQNVNNGKFREDLYYRLNTVPIKVPALKERPEDILMLFRKFTMDISEKYRSELIELDDKAKLMLENYSWPGNIRELKNVAEQISILKEDKLVTAEILLSYMPNILKRNLPAMANRNGGGGNDFQEREILYKLLFEMKSDLNDLKSLVFGMIQNNDLNVDGSKLRQLQSPDFSPSFANRPEVSTEFDNAYPEHVQELEDNFGPSIDQSRPIIIPNNGSSTNYDKMEVVDENLSLEEMEKEMIKKALKKYKGRRKDAAKELGISERTLYRKIKFYDV